MVKKDFTNLAKTKLLDEAYEKLSQVQRPGHSLFSFLKSPPINHWLLERMAAGPWAELGCGTRSVFESWSEIIDLPQKNDLFGFDLSRVAIAKAQAYGSLYYQQCDLTLGLPHGPYSIILDGHFLHCLNSVPEVFQTLGKIKESLCVGGIYIGEVMLAHKYLSFETQFEYDVQNNILYKEGIPSRVIMDAFEWEDMFLACGFKIQYFVCQSSIKIIPEDGREVPMNGDPECLRFCLERIK